MVRNTIVDEKRERCVVSSSLLCKGRSQNDFRSGSARASCADGVHTQAQTPVLSLACRAPDPKVILQYGSAHLHTHLMDTTVMHTKKYVMTASLPCKSTRTRKRFVRCAGSGELRHHVRVDLAFTHHATTPAARDAHQDQWIATATPENAKLSSRA